MRIRSLQTTLLPWISLSLTFAAALATAADQPDIDDLKSRYYKEHPGKGKFSEHWQPIDIQKYWNPKDFYKPPASVPPIEASGKDCIGCHKALTPGAYHAWQKSAHARLNSIRMLDEKDSRFYKKEKLAEIEANLVRQGLLEENQMLDEVGCIDCHGKVGAESIDHVKELVMPDRAVCGTCHVQEFAEAESEKNQEWPQQQWGKGHPSHAVDWKANVENAVWAAMPQREIAQGCDMCHYQQNKCDGCHTRHTFSVAEARQPEACATCHNGADHNEFENYLLSKHGTVYQTQGRQWDFEVPLKDALGKGGYTAPTCQYCHFEFAGEFSHNLVRKVRWAFNPTPEIAKNLDHPWFEERKEAWTATCSHCHSATFAGSYLDTADRGTIQGIEVEQEAKKVVQALYDDGLLPGQKTNRPLPPKPESDSPGGFFQLFWARGNNPSRVERTYADMWEHDLIKLYKGLFHVNPGGFTYTEGWSELMRDYAEIMDENVRLRDKASEPAAAQKSSRTDTGQTFEVAGAAASDVGLRLVLGTSMVYGGLLLFRRNRKKK
ncbi:MAG: hydroxylamine reductase [Methylococcaceae bacterium]|nr:hydroxylamine reductase [Methylococcaceae bacterium]MCI0733617.1 hydroxylamine reductase [Methylococcaceae bacterium]